MNQKKGITQSLGMRWILSKRYRINGLNKNWLCAICGDTGSGKSYSALSLAYMIGGAVYTVFSPKEFLQVINNKKIKKGDVIIFDEAGVGMSSRDWYKVQNKVLGSVLQTFRNMNVAVIFTMPNISFIDTQARKLFHNFMETSFIDFKKEVASLKVFDIQVNNRVDKTYFKYPIFNVDGYSQTLKSIGIPKPSEKAIFNYEKKKKAYTINLNREALEQLGGGQIEEKNIVEQIVKNKARYLKTYQGRTYFDKDLIASEFKVGYRKALQLKKQAEQLADIARTPLSV